MTRRTVFHILLLVFVVAAVYANSLGGEFVYDDKPMIAAYDLVKDLRNVPKAFVSPTSLYGNVNYYRPAQTISYMADYFLWGEYPSGYHLTNVIWHILAAVMVYFLMLRLYGRAALALAVSLLFGAHPVNTSVVSYIAGRADAILTVFMAACLIFHIRHRFEGGRRSDLLLSLAFFALALFAKEAAMVIPFGLVVFDRYAFRFTGLEGKEAPRSWNIPFFAALACYLLFRFMKMGFFVEGAVRPFPFWNRLISAPYFLAQYLRLAVLPNDLHIGRQPLAAGSPLDPRVLVSAALAAAFFFLAYKARKTIKAVWFGALWFVFMIFPSLNIITPLFYTIAENWLYIPSVGLYLAAAALGERAHSRLTLKGPRALEYVVPAALCAAVLALGALTVRQNLAWRDEIALGENTLKFSPRDFKVYNNMGVEYLGRGDLDKAEEHFRKCLEIKPDTGMAYFNLYRIYLSRGRREEALGYLEEARRLDPRRVGILVEKMGIKD